MSDEPIEQEIIEERAQDAPPQQEDDLEVEARKYGWKPKEEFDLEPDGWVDAEKFLSFPKTQLKMRNDTIRDLRKEIEEGKKQAAEEFDRIKATNKVALERVRKQEQERFDAEMSRIREGKRQAVEVADTDAFDRLDAQEKALKPPAPVEPQQAGPDPLVAKYRAENEWAQDPALFNDAVQVVQAALNSGMQFADTQAQLDYAEKAIQRRYPHMFQKPETPAPRSKVDPGGMGLGAKRGKGAADLPPEAAKIAKEFVEEGIFKSVDDYAKDYWAQEV